MKRTLKITIKILVFSLILLICFQTINNVLKRKYSYKKMNDFFSQKENFDVLFLGSSRMLNDVYPMELWNKYGIISYNLGNHNERITISYHNMKLALEHTSPKLVVIDTYLIYANEKLHVNGKSYMHTSLDAYPFSYTKYLAVKDLFDGENLISNESEFLFNLSIYHSRWKELTQDDFETENQYEKGAESRIAVAEKKELSDYNSVKAYEGEENVCMAYLRSIIEYCQQNNMEVLAIYLPPPTTDKNVAYSKYVQNICDEYNVNYINFLNTNVVDSGTDFFDEHHLNPSGARKISDYLGEYIMKNYDIQDQRNNSDYSFWNEDYDEYIDFKIKNLENNEKNLNNYLMLLYDEKDIKYDIKVSSKNKINEGSTLQLLLANINNNYQIDDEAFKDNIDKTIKITTYDNRSGELIKTVWF